MTVNTNYHRYPGELVQKDHSGFLNDNIRRWCALCGNHQPQLSGGLRHVFGSRHWVCSKHRKVEPK